MRRFHGIVLCGEERKKIVYQVGVFRFGKDLR